jgi:DnaK suppressor protein
MTKIELLNRPSSSLAVKTTSPRRDSAPIRGRLLALRAELASVSGARGCLRLKQVEAALDKLARGRYGLCDSCAQPVAAARLLVEPAVRYCGDCAGEGEPGLPADVAAELAALTF